MSILFTLTDKDIGMPEQEVKAYKIRIAARGIVLDSDGKIAIQKKNNTHEYKLIGGGIEKNEEPSYGFRREVLEETGCSIDIIKELGITEEYITSKGAKHISHVFVAKVSDYTNNLALTEKEKEEGAELIWLTPQEALRLMEESYDKLVSSTYAKDYDVNRMKFISIRDRKILTYFIENYSD